MSSAERVLRWRPPICLDSAVASADDDEGDGGEALDIDSDDEDRLDEDAYGYFILGLNCPIEAMFLTRRMDRAAPQSMKAKVAPFHNFILERGGALKLCRRETDKRQTCSNSHAFKHANHLVDLSHESAENNVKTVILSAIVLLWLSHESASLNRAFILPSVYFLWFCCQLIFTLSGFMIRELDITRWHLRMPCVFNHCCLKRKKHNITIVISYLNWRQVGFFCNPSPFESSQKFV